MAADRAQRRPLRRAMRPRVRAAAGEGAAGRRGERRRQLALHRRCAAAVPPDRPRASPPAAPACTDAAAARTDRPSRACSTGRPQIHHQHLVGDVAHHREVVADEQVGEARTRPAGPSSGSAPAPGSRRRAPTPARPPPPRADSASARGRSRCAGAGRRRTCADSGRTGRARSPTFAIIARAAASRARAAAATIDRERLLQDRAHGLARIERAVRVLEHHLHGEPQSAPRRAVASAVGAPSISSSPCVGAPAARPCAPASTCRSPDSPTIASVRPGAQRERHAVDRLHQARAARTARRPTG